MYICEMIRQFNEIFCSTIRNWESQRTRLAMLTARDLSRSKQFRQIVTFYSKVTKDTTQDEKKMLETKGTKRGHSGQKETIGTFFFSSLVREFTRVATARRVGVLSMKPHFYGLLTFS